MSHYNRRTAGVISNYRSWRFWLCLTSLKLTSSRPEIVQDASCIYCSEPPAVWRPNLATQDHTSSGRPGRRLGLTRRWEHGQRQCEGLGGNLRSCNLDRQVTSRPVERALEIVSDPRSVNRPVLYSSSQVFPRSSAPLESLALGQAAGDSDSGGARWR